MFVDFGVCPEGLRRVPVYTGAQFSLLQPDPKRAPKWEPTWNVWDPKSELYSLWGTICEKLVPKKLHRKKVAESGGVRRLKWYKYGGTGPLKGLSRTPRTIQIRIKKEDGGWRQRGWPLPRHTNSARGTVADIYI